MPVAERSRIIVAVGVYRIGQVVCEYYIIFKLPGLRPGLKIKIIIITITIVTLI